jgi:hypothetical protein
MQNVYTKILKVNAETGEVAVAQFADINNLTQYLEGILGEIADNEGDREYFFDPNRTTTKPLCERVVFQNNADEASISLATLLASVEADAQDRVAQMGVKIQRGVLIVSYVKMTELEYKLIISKADYTEFMEEDTGLIKFGLATKKRLFKSFVANYSMVDGQLNQGKIITYDTNKSKSTYWWKDFLELKEVRNNTTNTKTAFEQIQDRILGPLESKYKSDFLELWNRTIAYFRVEGDFDINHYRDTIIGTYSPADARLSILELKEKVTNLPSRGGFDAFFHKDTHAVRKRFKKEIELTDEISLNIKQDVPSLKNLLKAELNGDGDKCILIKSDKGYEYAKNLTI